MKMNQQENKETNLGGRPAKYQPSFNRQAYKLCLLGATDKDLADFFEVAESSINGWKKDFPRFLESIKKGKTQADATVAETLYKKANGYSRREFETRTVNNRPVKVKIVKYYPPDTTAAIFWLKNRQRDKWRDKQIIDFGFDSMTDDQLNMIVEKLKYIANDKRRKS